jgi:hypothetical protein
VLQGEEEGAHGEQQDAKVALEHGAVLLPVSGDLRKMGYSPPAHCIAHGVQRLTEDGAIAERNASGWHPSGGCYGQLLQLFHCN